MYNKIISYRDFIKYLLIATIALYIIGCGKLFDEKKPNFIFILIDDLGWMDLHCYGSKFYETPNIDKLSLQGVRFVNAYSSSPVCSPTRASILTGKHPARLGITNWIPGTNYKNQKLIEPKSMNRMPLQEITFAEALKNAGYSTAFMGKWHLGNQGFYPENQGFDLNIGGHWSGSPASYFYPYKDKYKQWDVPGLSGGKKGEFLTDRLTDEAISFIEKKYHSPFLLYLSYYALHIPLDTKPEIEKIYNAKLQKQKKGNGLDYSFDGDSVTKQKQDNPIYASVIQIVDENIGRIMKKLDDLNIEDDTIIILASDNGGLSTLPKYIMGATSNVPLRAGKGFLYEGGIRTPLIIKWPGMVKKIGSLCNEPVISMDFYPTILEMAGLPLCPSQHTDGVSLVPLLKDKKKLGRSALFWHYPHYSGYRNKISGKPSGALRMGDYKLIEWLEDGSTELYNLNEDIGELNDLSDKMPEKAKELYNLLQQKRRKTSAEMPVLYLNHKM